MFAKIFSQIFDSSIVEFPEVRVTFMDMLILSDSNGVVDMTHEAIARRTNRPIATILTTIAVLESPDARSRTPDADGRRIKRLDDHRDWGWVIINYDHFRKIASEEQRRAKSLARVQKHRDKIRGAAPCNAPVTPCNASLRMKRHAEAEAEAEGEALAGEREAFLPEIPSWSLVKSHAEMTGLAEWKARDWFDEMEGCGWVDYRGRKVCKWSSIMDRVKAQWEADGRPMKKPGQKISSNGERPKSALDLKTIIQAKNDTAGKIRTKFCSDVAMGSVWSNDEQKEHYFKLKREAKELTQQLGNMA